MEYLGHNSKYWLELEKKAVELDVCDYIKEIAELRGKLSFLSSRVKEMNEVIEKFL